MAHRSHSSDSSGFGTLLARGFMGLVSITATAVVSTMVQRYLSNAPNPVSPGNSLAPAATEASTVPSASGTAPEAASPVSSEAAPPHEFSSESAPVVLPPEQNQPLASDNLSSDNWSSDNTSAPSSESGQPPIIVNTSEPAASTIPEDGSHLRDQLNETLQEKWNK